MSSGDHHEPDSAALSEGELEESLDDYWKALVGGQGASIKPVGSPGHHSDLDSELQQCMKVLELLSASYECISQDSHVDDGDTQLFAKRDGGDDGPLLVAGTEVGHCRIEGLLGRGGMGEVYLAIHATLECRRAIKVLRKSLAENEESARRFLKEAKALGRVAQHPNVVAATHAGLHTDGRLYLEMEYWAGIDLARYVAKQGPLSLLESCQIIREVAKGLEHLHRYGIVHRDIKPSNLLRTTEGITKILDLGLAKLAADEIIRRDTGATQSSDLLGTLDYISPEQAEDPTLADARSDLYSLGCTFYFLLTGQAPFSDHETRRAKLVAHLTQPVRPITEWRDDVPESIVVMLDRLLRKEPDERIKSAGALIENLDRTCTQLEGSLTRRIPVGIDLGTTFSVIATLDPSTGRPITLRSEEGELTTPSAVLVEGDEVIVGREALRAWQLEPDRVAVCAKRSVGLKDIAITVDGTDFPPEVIQAFILRKIFDDARSQIGDPAALDAVISVPAYFDEVRRRATYQAAFIAGINVLDIINEPTAAALACGVQQGFLAPDGRSSATQHLLVYDLGGGTFDVTLMLVEGDEFRTLATDGDVQLGGKDWDKAIADFVAEHYRSEHGMDLWDEPRYAARLWQDAEEAKKTVSKRQKAVITCDYGGKGERLEISREEFERRTSHLLERTEFTTRSVLKAAGVDWAAIDRLILVGGATRMPMVRQMLQRAAGREPEVLALPQDEAVAHGAAIYAELLLADQQGRARQYQVRNVNSHSLGVVAVSAKTGESEVVTLVPRNTPLPVFRKRSFLTSEENQQSIAIKVVEGENPIPANCTQIGELVVTDLPDRLPVRSRVDVLLGYKGNGQLGVQVRIADQRHQGFSIQREERLGTAELQHWRRRIGGDGDH